MQECVIWKNLETHGTNTKMKSKTLPHSWITRVLHIGRTWKHIGSTQKQSKYLLNYRIVKMCNGRTLKHISWTPEWKTKLCHITKLQECVLEKLGNTHVQTRIKNKVWWAYHL